MVLRLEAAETVVVQTRVLLSSQRTGGPRVKRDQVQLPGLCRLEKARGISPWHVVVRMSEAVMDRRVRRAEQRNRGWIESQTQ